MYSCPLATFEVAQTQKISFSPPCKKNLSGDPGNGSELKPMPQLQERRGTRLDGSDELGVAQKFSEPGQTAGFGLWFHLPRCHFWCIFLSHSHFFVRELRHEPSEALRILLVRHVATALAGKRRILAASCAGVGRRKLHGGSWGKRSFVFVCVVVCFCFFFFLWGGGWTLCPVK